MKLFKNLRNVFVRHDPHSTSKMNPVVKALAEVAPAPIRRSALRNLLGLSDRNMRELIEKARLDGWMIENDCNGDGYYLALPQKWDVHSKADMTNLDAETLDQMEQNYRREYSRMKKTAITLSLKRSFLQAAGRDV